MMNSLNEIAICLENISFFEWIVSFMTRGIMLGLFLVIPVLIVLVQMIRFLISDSAVKDENKNLPKGKTINIKNMGKADLSNKDFSNLMCNSASVVLDERNRRTELMKSYVIVPLEMYFYVLFMLGAIYVMGKFFEAYQDNPILGVKKLVDCLHKDWIAAVFLFGLFMHRVVIKKIDDIIEIQGIKFKNKKK
ncbi:hypothetical protein [Fibrobacter sp. UWB16]|uniref:hypothetical protein n=1 Tax=Fibrobacter sp. UWB16 TaxID=1945874 RepID=UPI0011AF927D|nr:hypothetical protein [Fibrobacter sp. UWB16]